MTFEPGKLHNSSICTEADAVKVTYVAKLFAQDFGFNLVMQSIIATAVSELAMNIVKYAGRGYIVLGAIQQMGQQGIEIVAEDQGPGIPDRVKAMTEQYSTSKSLGLGLPSVRKLMDEFMMDSHENLGTKIVTRKWIPK